MKYHTVWLYLFNNLSAIVNYPYSTTNANLQVVVLLSSSPRSKWKINAIRTKWRMVATSRHAQNENGAIFPF